MSAQTIIKKNSADTIDHYFIRMAEKLLMYKRFIVGNSYNQDEFKELYLYDTILCDDSYCSLYKKDIEKLQEKINLLTI